MDSSPEKLEEVCRRYRIRRPRVFGAVLREGFGPSSDRDVSIEFEPDAAVGLAIVDVQNALSEVFGGRKVDLVNPKYVSRFIRDEVLASAEEIYAV